MAANEVHVFDDAAVRVRYNICPECDEFSPRSEKITFCMRCGARLIDECPGCREPILYPTAHYCPACGAGLRKMNGSTMDKPT